MDNPPLLHPRFDRPPVVETVFGIHFAPVRQWQIPYFGLFWSTIRDRYPKFSVNPLVPNSVDDLEKPIRPKSATFSIMDGVPPIRCGFFNESETQLVQIQHDAFYFNWKKGLTGSRYPHYETMRPVLVAEWSHFGSFVSDMDFGNLDVIQCEVSYINHIELGGPWKGYGELESLLTVWSGKNKGDTLMAPEQVQLGMLYRMPERMGRLQITAEPAIRNDDYKEIIQLTLSARGRPGSSDRDGVLHWFDFAQAYVAQSFYDLTTDEMHSHWGLRGNK